MCFQILQIQLQHRIALLYCLAALYQCLKSLSVQFYCIDSDMNQNADSGIHYKSNSMLCVKYKCNLSVLRSTYIRIFRCHRSSVSHHLPCKGLIRHRRKVSCQTCDRRAYGNGLYYLLSLRLLRLYFRLFCFRRFRLCIGIRGFF